MAFTSYSGESAAMVAQGDITKRFYPAAQVDAEIEALRAQVAALIQERDAMSRRGDLLREIGEVL